MTPAVRLATPSDLPTVCEIINHYIATTTFNFRTDPQSPDEWLADWRQYHEHYPWLVATIDGALVGVAYATPWKTRAAYDWSVEVTVYVAHGCTRRGIGRALYQRLLSLLDAQGYRTQIAVIALPNDPSIAVHEAFGFRPAGMLRDVGFKHGSWRDVGFWQRRTGSFDEAGVPIRPVPDGGA